MSIHSFNTESIARRDATLARIHDNLTEQLVHPDNISDAYIKFQDVREAWSGYNTIQTALYPANLRSEEIDDIRDRRLKLISVLVWVEAHDVLHNFRTHFLSPEGKLFHIDDQSLPLKNEDVGFINNFFRRSSFITQQYLFIPHVIAEEASVQKVDDKLRLPFEKVSKNLFAGAYGTVDKVGISALHLQTLDGGSYDKVRYVACKRFHPQRDTSRDESHRELSNLQVLKESITSHANIRLHLAIIFHKSEHFIILPWAEHLDLEIFLLEGHDFRGGTIYDFNLRFPGVQPGGMVAAVCKQMHHVADALRWLHNGIITQGKQQSKICFAHMDLKPNNILIDKGSSPVGRWVLTDFGISAFKEDEGSEPNNFVSIRDYYQNLTINTQPRRDPGAYQPPEVENTGNNVLEGRITAKEGHAGRRGDIWSFGCILAEVLVFALGQTPLVKQFRKHRKGPKEKHYSTDYFYEEIPSETLRPNATGKHYRVRPWIEDFLRRLSDTYTPLPNNTINCCVETILEILVTDGDHRPNADLLLDKLSHVEKHVSTAMFSGETPSNCPWKRRSKRPERPTNHLKEGESVGREDSMTNGAYAIDPWESHLSGQSPERLDSHQQNTPRPPFQPPGTPNERLDQVSCNHDKLTIPSPPIANLSASSAEVPVLDNPSVPAIMRTNTTEIENLFAHSGPFRNESHSIAKSAFGLGISSYPEGQSPAPESLQSHNIDRRLSKESRRGLHGVLIDQERLRRVQPSVEIVLSGLAKRKLIGFSICPSGRRVAHLTELKSKYEVSMSQLSLDMRREGEQHLVPLPDGITWQGIQIASNYVVARGLTPNGAKQVYVSNSSTSKIWTGPQSTSLASLITIVVSTKGSLALVCSKCIIYVVVESVILEDQCLYETIRAKEDHSFTHAAFNDDGSLLYAWEFGRPDDRLSVWRISDSDRTLLVPTDSEGSYQSIQIHHGNPSATLIPYNSYHGCIIRTQGDSFFPAQIRSTQRGSDDKLEKVTTNLPSTFAACMYSDHVLLVIERGLTQIHGRIRELRVAGGGMHVIAKPGKADPVVKMKNSALVGSQMRAVAVPNTDDLIIVVCMPNGKVEFIPVVF